MGCLQPLSILDKNRATPSTDGRMSVPCGRCHRCKQKRRMDWTFRLMEELRDSSSAIFITLTYDEKSTRINKQGHATIDKRDLQLFLKKTRRTQTRDFARNNSQLSKNEVRRKCPRIRYYACGEYGTLSERPHYHIIMFNATNTTKDKLPRTWGKGHVHCGTCNIKTIMYTTKYIMKSSHETENNRLLRKLDQKDRTPEFSLQSTKPAIGARFLEKNQKMVKDRSTFHAYNQQGRKQRLPKYFREKIFNKSERKSISKQETQESLKAQLREEKRIERLGNTLGKYERDQLRDEIRRLHIEVKKSESL